MSSIPAYTFGGITRPELFLDPSGNIVLDPVAQAFVDTYGLKTLYMGCPPGTPFPPVPGLITTPVDADAAGNNVAEGAAVNTVVHITASAHDILGFPITYSLTADSSGGGFKINASTGVVTVADGTKIDYETSPGHAYSITVRASDGIFSSSQTFTIGVTDVAPSTPTDSNAAANSVAEGAANGTTVGVTVASTDVNGPAVTYSLTGDTSGGGFTINATTGVISVADHAKIDYETSPGHAYTVTARASDGTLSSSQTFTINVADVAISAPVDANAAANSVAEGAVNGSTVGITALATDPNGPATTYSLIGDTSGGGFAINATTGVVTVADATKIDYESAAGHAYSVTVQAVNGATTSSQSFSIAVTDVAPSAPTDSNAAANAVAEGAANGTLVGVTAASTDVNGPAVTYSLTNNANGAFAINAATGVVSVADATKIDYETAPGHAYTITAQASDGTLTSSQSFTIAVTDVAPSTPTDSNAAANTVAEGAANGTTVGVTASATDVNGPAVTYSLTGDTSGGGFTINAATGVVTVADSTKIDYESAAGHAYTVTAQASDGTLTSSQTFTIAVSDVAPSAPVDSDAAANTVVEGAANGSTVGVTASSTDVNGPAVTYSLAGDSSGGGFTINAMTGVVTVADSTKIDFESAAGHAYTITTQASDGTLTSSQTFTVIAVTDTAPSTPTDSDAAANTVVEGAANGSTVGITAASTDINGPAVNYSLIGDTSGGGFTINAATGVVTVADATKIDYETAAGHAYTVTAQASDGTLSSSQTFTIAVTDIAPSAPVDGDAGTNTVAEGAANGSTVGVTASSTDVNGPAVTYSLTGDTSGGGFTINAATGVVTVADATKIDYESAAGHAYTVTAQASDGTFTSSQTFTIAVTDVAPSTPVDGDAATNTIAEGAANGSTVGVTASSTDVNGPAVTYSLTGDTSGGGFTINAATGVVTVADATKIDYETAAGHAYTVTAQASDGTLTSSQAFVIAVSDVAPSTPTDSDAATNTVAAGAPAGTYTGLTASSTDVNGPAVTYTLTDDTSGGGFAIDSTGKVTIADPTKVIYNAGNPTYDVTVVASDGTLHSQQTFTINVILDAIPVVTAGHTLAYTENQVATAIDPALTVTDSDNANLAHATVQITGNYVNGEDVLGFTNQNGITGSFNAATGTLTLTGSSSVANYQTALASVTYFNTSDNPSGAARTVTIITNDGTLDSTPATDTINVTPVNDAPVVTAGHTLSYTENQAATVIDSAITVSDVDSANLASATVQITGNYANGQDVLGFTNQNGITGSFDAGTGTLTLTGTSSVANYQTALDSITYFNNSDNPSGLARTVTIITNDGAANSVAKTDTINVTPVNDPPVTTAGGTLNYTENQVATAIDSSVTVSDVDNANLASATVQITGNYANGQDVLGFTNQNGIIGSFNAGTGMLTLTGSSSVANYKTALDSVTYFNNSDNPSGLDRTVTYIANDGAVNSNSSTSTIHVTPVNDAPVVNATGTLSYTENQAAAAIAPALTLTDADTTSLTTASVQISANYVNGEDLLAFSNTATITSSFDAATGTLTLTGTDTVANYQAALRSVSYADNSDNPSTAARTVTFTADDGQATNHLSAGSNHTINVTAVNDAPANNGVPANFTVMSGFTHAITGLSISDVDASGGTDITTTLTSAGGGAVTVGAVGGGAVITGNSTGAVTLTGSIAQINASLAGNVVYTAADGATGSSTTTLTIATNDHGHTGTGGPLTDTDIIQVGVTPQVWFINGDQSTLDANAPRGSQTNPFSDVTEFNASSGPGVNDYIYVKAGTYSGPGINLKDGQILLGDDQPLSLPDPFGGPAIVIEAATGARPVIHVTTAGDQGIDLASNNTVAGIDIQTDAGTTGLDDGQGAGGNAVGSLNVSHMAITGAGQAVDIDQGGALNVTIDTLSSSGGAFGVQLAGTLTGSFTGTAGTLSGHTTSEFDVNGGTGTISYGGTIGDGTGLSASIASHTGGSVTLSGSITDSNDAGGGISLSGNTGSTISFSGGMTLITGASNAFSATGGGTLTVTGTNHLTTTTGTALNISNTTIGSGNVTFHDISANGAATGILLNNTGSNGHLAVTGSGSTAVGGDNSGGVIQHTTNYGISLTNTLGPSFTNMSIHDIANNGIDGTDVTNFTFANGNIATTGTALNGQYEENAIAFVQRNTFTANTIDGTVNITGNTISNVEHNGISIETWAGTISNLNISGNTLTAGTTDNHILDGIHVFSQGSASGTASITTGTINNNTISGFELTTGGVNSTGGNGIRLAGGNNASSASGTIGTAADPIVIDGNTISNMGSNGIATSFNGQNGLSNVRVTNNNISHVEGLGISVFFGGNGTFSGLIDSNTVNGTSETVHAGSSGIGVQSDQGNATSNVTNSSFTVSNNTVSNESGDGILATGINNSGTMNVRIIDNHILSVPDLTARFGIRVQQSNTSPQPTVNLEIHGNDTAGGNPVFGPADGIGIRQQTGFTFGIEGLSPSPATAAQAAAYINSQNPGETTTVISGNNFTNVNVPNSPLLAAPGGVQASSPTAGETHLTQAELNSVVAAAIAQWAHAGASGAQLAALTAMTFTVADLPGNTIGQQSAGHIVIDTNAAGHGWFIDPTPSDNFEFTHAANATGTDLFTDPANAAAGHLDLLTTVTHEMGHELGLGDNAAASSANDLMYINLADGERRLPTAADVAQANASVTQANAVGPQTSGVTVFTPTPTPAGGSTAVSIAGADHFVFGPTPLVSPLAPAPAHTIDYSATQGGTFDFSALTSQSPGHGVGDAMHAAGGAGAIFATLQGYGPSPSAWSWLDVAHFAVDNHPTVHLAQIHVDLLV
jgi:large repetitive protein